ncbi:hypothetical protein [Streptomyces sp. NPDC002825]|uniref:hypothetical protein n=1 Tax=Streptomyces sp. NPDC002825 TaxID=3154666 RepID=UPI003333DD1C
MSASENSERNPLPRTGPYAVPDRPGLTRGDDPDVDEAYEPAVLAGLRLLPAPSAETARGTGGGLRAAARAHRTVTAGAAAGTAAALALAYGWGRRTGRLAARRGLGPVALFFGRRS